MALMQGFDRLAAPAEPCVLNIRGCDRIDFSRLQVPA
jgi:hypothetical protein